MQVIISKQALRQYKRLPPGEQRKIKKKLKELEVDPYSGKKLSGELSKYRSLRVWPYRVIYAINKVKQRVEVSEILHRQSAYK